MHTLSSQEMDCKQDNETVSKNCTKIELYIADLDIAMAAWPSARY